jgi:TonB family protein
MRIGAGRTWPLRLINIQILFRVRFTLLSAWHAKGRCAEKAKIAGGDILRGAPIWSCKPFPGIFIAEARGDLARASAIGPRYLEALVKLAALLFIPLLVLTPALAPAQARDTSGYPMNGPFTSPPELINRDQLARLARERFPERVRSEGFGGTPTVRMYVDTSGAVLSRRIERSSAIPALDSAALEVADSIRFAPARNGTEAVPLWVSIPVQFHLDVPRDSGEIKVPPRVKNFREVGQALWRMVEGRIFNTGTFPQVAIFVARSGEPQAVELIQPSGDPHADYAALRAATLARFEPARDPAGEPMGVWVSIEIRPFR